VRFQVKNFIKATLIGHFFEKIKIKVFFWTVVVLLLWVVGPIWIGDLFYE